MAIELSNYPKFLAEIHQRLKQTQDKIADTVTRQKVVMSWQIGQSIDQHLQKNNRGDYGKKLIEKLSQDISISKSVLYQMRSFYQAYPKLPKDENGLNWSHYQTLSGIKEMDKRKYFEGLIQKKNLDVRTLEQEIKEVERNTKSKKKSAKKSSTKKINSSSKKLSPTRGKLFSYPVIKLEGSSQNYLDCGFGIFREVEEKLPKAAEIIEVVKRSSKGADEPSKGNYILQKSTATPRELHIYKAKLERIVDGDTIHVILDLGFKIFHREILRLAKINAPESDTRKGKKSTKVLKEILRDVPFLIIKSIKTDIYGRYVADVFLAGSSKTEPSHFRIAC